MLKSAFVDYVVQDLLGEMPGVRSRAMFGGYGIYREDRIFAIVVDDQLYFKAGENDRKDYQRLGSAPFSYQSAGKTVTMSYWEVPAEILEDRRRIAEWAQKAIEAGNAQTRRAMKSKVKRGSSKFRSEHASKKPKIKSAHMTGQVSGFPRGNRSAKKRSH